MSECQRHEGSFTKSGYGQVYIRPQRVPVYAHRLAWALHNGQDPSGLVVMHTCDNRWCINPEHLVAGTQRQNMDDMVKKDRHNKGERNAAHKITATQAAEIVSSVATTASLAKAYGLSRAQIGRIRRGEMWQTK